jgi:hypothetical protein
VAARQHVSYSEDVDRVVEILRQASAELMEDEALRPLILDPFDYQGVDTLDAVLGGPTAAHPHRRFPFYRRE